MPFRWKKSRLICSTNAGWASSAWSYCTSRFHGMASHPQQTSHRIAPNLSRSLLSLCLRTRVKGRTETQRGTMVEPPVRSLHGRVHRPDGSCRAPYGQGTQASVQVNVRHLERHCSKPTTSILCLFRSKVLGNPHSAASSMFQQSSGTPSALDGDVSTFQDSSRIRQIDSCIYFFPVLSSVMHDTIFCDPNKEADTSLWGTRWSSELHWCRRTGR